MSTGWEWLNGRVSLSRCETVTGHWFCRTGKLFDGLKHKIVGRNCKIEGRKLVIITEEPGSMTALEEAGCNSVYSESLLLNKAG